MTTTDFGGLSSAQKRFGQVSFGSNLEMNRFGRVMALLAQT